MNINTIANTIKQIMTDFNTNRGNDGFYLSTEKISYDSYILYSATYFNIHDTDKIRPISIDIILNNNQLIISSEISQKQYGEYLVFSGDRQEYNISDGIDNNKVLDCITLVYNNAISAYICAVYNNNLEKETIGKTRYYITIAVEICRITNNQYIPLYCADYREVNADISHDGLKYNIQDIYSFYIDEGE